MRRLVLVLACTAAAVLAFAQTSTEQLLEALAPRELGPTTMGGRVSDLAVYEGDPRIFYVASASGGLWKTTTAGMEFEPVFFRESSAALGAVGIHRFDPDVVWVGTGEQNNRNSTSFGYGVYRSLDGGASWDHMGLEETRHISSVIVHPDDPNTVYVGALGHLWGPNDERGVYKTTDGGETWDRLLFVDDVTGVVDMVMHPDDPDTLIVAMYQRERTAYSFSSGGPGSGIYKTTDGGETWTESTAGLPEGDLGRIGIDYYRSDPSRVAATIEAEKSGVFVSEDGGDSWTRTSSANPRAFYFSKIAHDPVDRDTIYLGAVRWHVSRDGGKTFRQMPLPVHADTHAIWINAFDNDHLISGNDGGVVQSRDGARTWEHFRNMTLSQFYNVAVDLRKPYHVYGGLQDNGSWAGPTQTLRGGVAFNDWYRIGGGDGFQVQVDPEDWTILYAESQGGAVFRLNQLTGASSFIRPQAPAGEFYRFNWNSPILISPHNADTVFFAGNKLFRSVDEGGNWDVISPDLTTNDPEKLRPAMGVSPEDTGAERHCTIVTVSESPIRPGTLWVGTDDGLIHVSRDGGQNWTEVGQNVAGVPQNTYVSRVVASNHRIGRAYATFDGHRNNDYNAYVYVTDDFGQSWNPLSEDLPLNESCYVIREGFDNEDLLFLGTEMGLWVSIDRGESWTKYRTDDFPTVRVDDLVLHPREDDLVVGTHGRGIWILPIGPLEQLDGDTLEEAVTLFEPDTLYLLGRVTSANFDGDTHWVSPNTQPAAYVYYHLAEDVDGEVEVRVTDASGETTYGTLEGPSGAGIHRLVWIPRGAASRLPSGDLRLVLSVDGEESVTTLRLENLTETVAR